MGPGSNLKGLLLRYDLRPYRMWSRQFIRTLEGTEEKSLGCGNPMLLSDEFSFLHQCPRPECLGETFIYHVSFALQI